jgi:hypothetical protein
MWMLACCQRLWQRLRLRLLLLLRARAHSKTLQNPQLDEEYRAVIRELDDILAAEV